MNNETCAPHASSDRAALYAFIATLVNLALTLVVPYMFKLRPVQRVLHPRRVEHKLNLQHDLASCISSMQQLAKTLSERSSDSSGHATPPIRLDPLASSNA